MMNDESRQPGPESGDLVPSFIIPNSSLILHSIRLRGAWMITPAGDRTRHARRFGWPTTLDPHERVWLVWASPAGPAAVSVNDAPLGTVPAGAGSFAADVTPHLRPRNELVIDAPAGAPVGEVGLEVRRSDSAPV
jgi:hypothetical protein